MEVPDERDAQFRKHVYSMKEQCEKLRATWANPSKPYGSWKTDKNIHKFLQDLTLSHMAGRNEALSYADSRS